MLACFKSFVMKQGQSSEVQGILFLVFSLLVCSLLIGYGKQSKKKFLVKVLIINVNLSGDSLMKQF